MGPESVPLIGRFIRVAESIAATLIFIVGSHCVFPIKDMIASQVGAASRFGIYVAIIRSTAVSGTPIAKVGSGSDRGDGDDDNDQSGLHVHC